MPKFYEKPSKKNDLSPGRRRWYYIESINESWCATAANYGSLSSCALCVSPHTVEISDGRPQGTGLSAGQWLDVFLSLLAREAFCPVTRLFGKRTSGSRANA
jgi:hypothetical protein